MNWTSAAAALTSLAMLTLACGTGEQALPEAVPSSLPAVSETPSSVEPTSSELICEWLAGAEFSDGSTTIEYNGDHVVVVHDDFVETVAVDCVGNSLTPVDGGYDYELVIAGTRSNLSIANNLVAPLPAIEVTTIDDVTGLPELSDEEAAARAAGIAVIQTYIDGDATAYEAMLGEGTIWSIEDLLSATESSKFFEVLDDPMTRISEDGFPYGENYQDLDIDDYLQNHEPTVVDAASILPAKVFGYVSDSHPVGPIYLFTSPVADGGDEAIWTDLAQFMLVNDPTDGWRLVAI